MAKGVSRDARNMEGHIRLRDRYYPPFLVAQWSVVRVEDRDISRQGNVVRSNQSGVRAQVDTLDTVLCTKVQNVPSLSHFRIPSFLIYYINIINYMILSLKNSVFTKNFN